MFLFKKNNVKFVSIIKMQNGQLLILAFGVLSVLDPRCSVPILKSLGGAGAEWVCNGNWKGKKILTLSSGIRVESLLVVLVRAAAPISRLAFFFVILESGRRVWVRNNVERVILRTELKTKRKKSSISKSYDQNKFSIVFLKETEIWTERI